jgi:hypothetical protein
MPLPPFEKFGVPLSFTSLLGVLPMRDDLFAEVSQGKRFGRHAPERKKLNSHLPLLPNTRSRRAQTLTLYHLSVAVWKKRSGEGTLLPQSRRFEKAAPGLSLLDPS